MSKSKEETLEILLEEKVVAVVRTPDERGVIEAVQALSKAGIRCFEITMTINGALNLLRGLVAQRPDLLIGAGTVLTEQEVVECIEAGAEFIVSPIFSPKIVSRAKALGKVVVPGAFTPSEVMRAWTSGADFVKIFPAARLGPHYLKDLKGPLPAIRLMPTGGINADNARDYLDAGADLVCAGSSLVDNNAIANNDFEALKNKARLLVKSVKNL